MDSRKYYEAYEERYKQAHAEGMYAVKSKQKSRRVKSWQGFSLEEKLAWRKP